MRFVDLLVGATAVAAVVAAPATGTPRKRKSSFEFTGVNESGAEFGNTAIPGQLGKDYIWPVHSTIDVGTTRSHAKE